MSAADAAFGSCSTGGATNPAAANTADGDGGDGGGGGGGDGGEDSDHGANDGRFVVVFLGQRVVIDGACVTSGAPTSGAPCPVPRTPRTPRTPRAAHCTLDD